MRFRFSFLVHLPDMLTVEVTIMPAQMSLSRKQQSLFLKFWLHQITPRRRQILWQVFEAYDFASTEKEKKEIEGVISSCLFRKWEDLWSFDPSECVTSEEARERLDRHRIYVGNQIKLHRKKQGLSQGELAQLCRIPQSHISNLENGKHTATFRTIKRVAKGLSVPPGVLDPTFDD